MGQMEKKAAKLKREMGAVTVPLNLINSSLPSFCVNKMLGAFRNSQLTLEKKRREEINTRTQGTSRHKGGIRLRKKKEIMSCDFSRFRVAA